MLWVRAPAAGRDDTLRLKRQKCGGRVCELTQQLRDQRRPFGLRQVDAQEVDGNPGQGDGDADQRVDGVAVEGDRHQEHGTQTEETRVQQGQLWRDTPGRGSTWTDSRLRSLFVHFI